MLAVKNLERLIEIEADPKAQYEVKLNNKSSEIAKAAEQQDALKAKLAKQKETLASQQKQISQLLSAADESSRIEQLNRELESRNTKLQDEVSQQKKRIKSLQKDLAVEREELKSLKQLDAQKLKQNLDANKKKLAEKTSANELLQKNYNNFKKENDALTKKVAELEEKVAAEEESEEAVPA